MDTMLGEGLMTALHSLHAEELKASHDMMAIMKDGLN